jgi:hypothetical protein
MDEIELAIRRAIGCLDLPYAAPPAPHRDVIQDLKLINGERGPEIAPERQYPSTDSE